MISPESAQRRRGILPIVATAQRMELTGVAEAARQKGTRNRDERQRHLLSTNLKRELKIVFLLPFFMIRMCDFAFTLGINK